MLGFVECENYILVDPELLLISNFPFLIVRNLDQERRNEQHIVIQVIQVSAL